jgi:outer membrane protein assembly factor BamA
MSSGGGVEGRIDENFKFVPVPYINYNRSIELSLGILPMAMFNPVPADTLSPSSLAGALAMYSTNKTWFVMAFAKLFVNEDNWRITGAGGVGAINFQFALDYPVNTIIPYNTEADFAYIAVERRIYSKIYLGVNYFYGNFKTTTESLPLEENANLNGLGVTLAMDQRSNVYYPRHGYLSEVSYRTFPDALGNEFVSQKIEIDHNHYFPFRNETDVLAARVYAGFGLGDLSFNQQYIVGGIDIRGYSQGAFRGDYMLAAQGEYRWSFYGKWTAVGFLGVATVFESINPDDDGKLLPGIGTGIRYMVFPENNMNVGLDVAVGQDDWGLYFRIGEAF